MDPPEPAPGAGPARNSPTSQDDKRDDKREQELVALYMAMTGADERTARAVYANVKPDREQGENDQQSAPPPK